MDKETLYKLIKNFSGLTMKEVTDIAISYNVKEADAISWSNQLVMEGKLVRKLNGSAVAYVPAY